MIWMFLVAAILLFLPAKHSQAYFTDLGLNISIPPNIISRFLPDFTPQVTDFINTGKQVQANIQKDASRLGIPQPSGNMSLGQAIEWLGGIFTRGFLFISMTVERLVHR